MKLSEIKRDAAAITAGQWVTDIPEMDKLRLKVRGLSSPIVSALQSRLERAVPRKDRNPDGSLKPDAQRRISGQVLLEAVLLDWEGVDQENGKPQSYDATIAKTLLTDPDYLSFANAVAWAAQYADQTRKEVNEDLAGN